MLRSKYSNITFYCHNMAGYDIVFILKILYDFNDSVESDEFKYIINPLLGMTKSKLSLRKVSIVYFG